MANLFEIDEFASYMTRSSGEVVDNSSTVVCRRVASGWLKFATGLTDWPDLVDDQLFAWGLELAAIAYRNPDGAASEGTDDHQVTWDRARRRDILTAATVAYSGAAQPQYSFPDPDWHWTVVPTASVTTA